MGDSECPAKFKSSVIGSYTRHALTHCSTWDTVRRELDFVSQQLVNNGYSNKDIQRMKRKPFGQWYTQESRSDDGGNKIKLFYRNFMHSNYKQDEAAIRNIISNNVSATDPDSAIHSYIGMTTTRLSKRLSVHLQEGNFFQHYRQHHGVLQRPALLENTTIIDRDQDRRRLHLREALHIMKLKPTLNVTQETFLLPTNIRRTCPPRDEETTPVGIPVRTPAGPTTNQIPEIPIGPTENRNQTRPSQTQPSQNSRETPADTPATPANPAANQNAGIPAAAADPVNPLPEPHHPAPVRRSARLRHIAPTHQPMRI